MVKKSKADKEREAIIKEIDKYNRNIPTPIRSNPPCPSCGYCPTCGRSNTRPWNPCPPWNPYPYYEPYTITWNNDDIMLCNGTHGIPADSVTVTHTIEHGC